MILAKFVIHTHFHLHLNFCLKLKINSWEQISNFTSIKECNFQSLNCSHLLQVTLCQCCQTICTQHMWQIIPEMELLHEVRILFPVTSPSLCQDTSWISGGNRVCSTFNMGVEELDYNLEIMRWFFGSKYFH